MEDVRRALEEAGFDEGAVRATLGPAPFPAAVALAARRSGEPRVALVRLFVLGETLPAAEIPVDVRTLAAHGFVEELGDVVRPLVRLTPYEGMLFAHDGERNPSSDFVTGVNNTTRTTTTLTVRSEVESALDMGTGCGVQALLATRHARTVVATDVNRRALRYAAINARLNGRALDTRSGNWFEPVAGEHFDLIVSNPPYVISPDADYLYRDSGLEGDEVSREIVRAAAAHLREGGFATILCNWICRSEGETWQPLEPWVEDLSCDALLLAHAPVAPFRYAAQWNEPIAQDPEAFSAAVDRWLAYYEAAGAVAMGFGSVILRRRNGNVWTRGIDVPTPAVGNAGEHVLRLFAATDYPLPAELGAERFRPVPGHRLEQRLRFGDEYEPATVTMVLEEGVGTVANVDARALPVLFALDGETTVGEILVGATDEERLVAETTLRGLYDLGLLERR